MKKIYTAFIASESTLEKEREAVSNALLDNRILPIRMENFTAGDFSAIQELIDDSDFFIMLMGKKYGSIDSETDIGQTHKEYEYAKEQNKKILVIVCPPLVEDLNRIMRGEIALSDLSGNEQRQIAFHKQIIEMDHRFTREIAPRYDVKTIVNQYLQTIDFAKTAGWARVDDTTLNPNKLELWKKAHAAFDLAGTWYHVHLDEIDRNYIRVGVFNVMQHFTPNCYKKIKAEGINYNIDYYDEETGTFHYKRMQSTRYSARYTLEDNGSMFGIVYAKRSYKGTFREKIVLPGIRRSFHDFSIDVCDMTKPTEWIDGQFHDEAPDLKHGSLFLFRSEEERDEFLLELRSEEIGALNREKEEKRTKRIKKKR